MLNSSAVFSAMEGMPRRGFEKGAVIRQPDDASDTVFLIESGRAQCFYMTPQGSDAVLGELGAGDFIGDLAALDGGLPGACYEALECTIAILFRREQFLEQLRLSHLSRRPIRASSARESACSTSSMSRAASCRCGNGCSPS